ncbi:leucine-rich repeat-containing protein kinase family protein [Aurantibacillus circumpalustris]|uniref:leucine-rich repeat-containing protein kinase family protein n=1 Tax=Aurantibacillus circumpalustris TaxID=3036359 RepID=UPI00295BE3B1|nr:leucine-rich repeat-containing protein kinase family protein [Aurantibacillus circumpalustris]
MLKLDKTISEFFVNSPFLGVMHTLQQLISGDLKGSKHLKLNCGLKEFPSEIFSLSETLEVLDLSGNQLRELPKDFGRLNKLKIVFFSDNLFTELPSVLSDCKQLSMIGFKSNRINIVPENALPITTRWLILTNNQIVELPASLGNCLPLQKVALAGNKLTNLPKEMANCKNLELLRISANQFNELPNWLFELPKLSWLAFSGNPIGYIPKIENKLSEIDWMEFELEELLGEGASGHIYKAIWRTGSLKKEVAIKLYKGEVTSDGFPEDEMLVSIAAGIHPNLGKLLGEIKNHPNKKKGLIMDLIPASFSNLGMPPDFETCSRDTFKVETVFTATQILEVARAIAAAANHLHDRGISHGDLYAHNILMNESVECFISDFGAASFYKNESKSAELIEKIEVRAFGCLVDDLLLRLSSTENDKITVSTLKDLRFKAMQEQVNKRPFFKDIIKMFE